MPYIFRQLLVFQFIWCGVATCPNSESTRREEKLGINAVVPGNPSLVYKYITYFRRLMQQNKKYAKFMP